VVTIIFLSLFFFTIIIIYPIWDYWYTKYIKKRNTHKWKIYSITILSQWVTAVVLLIYWLSANHSFHDLFYLDTPLLLSVTEYLTGLIVGIGIALILLALLFFFSKTLREKIIDALTDESIAFLLPNIGMERFLFLILAISAGVCEELIFRGAMIFYLSHLPFDLSVLAIGVLSSLFFGLAHLYQGWKGVLSTAYIGAFFYFLFVITGSLWLPIILHILVDAKFVFLPNQRVVRN